MGNTLDDALSSGKNVSSIKFGEGVGKPEITAATSGDDQGVQIKGGQLNVQDGETVLGNIDSYVAPIIFHFDYANLSGLTITDATDITTILASDSGSTTGLFGGTAIGSAILVGSLINFGGVKAKIDTLGVVEPDNVTAEYLQDNTPTWVNASFMATDAEYPLDQKGNQISTCSSCSEQWYFGYNPDNLPTLWNDVTLNINGTDYTYKWALFRITSAITTDPIMEQIKLHTNRFEINIDGVSQYFGLSRYARDLIVNITANSDSSPGNYPIEISSGVTIAATDNLFQDNLVDGLIIRSKITVGHDTSIPVKLEVDWYPTTSNSGDVELEAEISKVINGFTYNGTAASSPTLPSVVTVDNELKKRKKSSFQFLIDDMLPGDELVVSLFRDAQASNIHDTLSGNIAIASARLIGYFWKP
jgi:hypothetical protein